MDLCFFLQHSTNKHPPRQYLSWTQHLILLVPNVCLEEDQFCLAKCYHDTDELQSGSCFKSFSAHTACFYPSSVGFWPDYNTPSCLTWHLRSASTSSLSFCQLACYNTPCSTRLYQLHHGGLHQWITNPIKRRVETGFLLKRMSRQDHSYENVLMKL